MPFSWGNWCWLHLSLICFSHHFCKIWARIFRPQNTFLFLQNCFPQSEDRRLKDQRSEDMRFYDEPVAFDMPAPRICSGARFLPVSFAIPKEDISTVACAKSMALHFYLCIQAPVNLLWYWTCEPSSFLFSSEFSIIIKHCVQHHQAPWKYNFNMFFANLDAKRHDYWFGSWQAAVIEHIGLPQ